MLKRYSLAILFLLLGVGLRFHALAYDARFHPDEALFATFARKAAVNGDWMLHGPLDKTPLSIYAEAISMMLVGARPLTNGVLTLDARTGELAARVPGTFASILLVAVMYALARGLYRKSNRARQAVPLQMAVIAAFLMAVSPYALAFSATAFTDGLMLLFIVLALWMESRGKWLWAGIWLALGFACKQQALFYVPLVVGVGWIIPSPQPPPRYPERGRSIGFSILRLVLPIVICLGVLAVWDGARAQDTSLWALAVANNDPGRLIYPEQALFRLQTWISYAVNFAGTGWMTAILGGVAAIGVALRMKHWRRDRTAWIDVILAAYIVVYGLFHWLVALPTHDRYLLPVLPLVILLMARGIEKIIKDVSQRNRGTEEQRKRLFIFVSLSIIGICFLAAAWGATEGRINVGGDRGEHAGIDRLGAYLDSKPLGTIVYDHWLGWELGYYLGTWSDKRLTYYPSPDALAADAVAQDDPAPRYFPVPRGVAVDAWLNRLTQAGFGIARDYESQKFVVYRLMPPK
ncbi:MAG: glycosyltransferase family 39 protein [Chloroflexota bacterium]